MKLFRRVLCVLLSVLLAASVFAACGKGGSDGKSDDNKPGADAGADLATAAVGDNVTMGKIDGEKITWTAVAKGVGTLLLVSDKVIARRPFNNDEHNFNSWKDSDIRTYLNGEFFDTVFSEAERAQIATAELKTEVFDFDSYSTNTETSEDKVFLLSCSEFARYVMAIKDFNWGVPTETVLNDKIYMAETGSDTVKTACGWALRDDGEQIHSNCLEVASYDGNVSYYGNDKPNKQGIRPAVWAYTDKDLAEGWKAGTADLPADETLNAKIAGLRTGDTVSFGSTTLRDTSKGPVEVTWNVLDETEDALLLFADQLMGAYRFSPAGDESVTWATSEVREYINGDDFINEYFNPWERGKILLSHISTCGGSAPQWEVDPGPETDDYLFLLDREEVEKYFPNEADRAIPEYIWWLRSPDFVQGWFNCVNEAGTIRENEAYTSYGLRPAMWIAK